MPSNWVLEDLDIIGYADVRNPSMVPAVVPPLFRSRSRPEVVIVPPFELNGDSVDGATVISFREAEHLRDNEQVTFFNTKPISAQPGHELWLDQDGELKYEPFDDARDALDKGAQEAMDRAEKALELDDLDAAEKAASETILHDDRRADVFALKAAIRYRRGNQDGVRLMADLAESLITRDAFDALVTHYRGLTPNRPAKTRRPLGAGPMHNAAIASLRQ